jgi:hypothetical protein
MLILRLDEVFRKQFVGLGLENEICQDPAMAGHLIIKTKIDESKIIDKAIIDDLAETFTKTMSTTLSL